MLLLVLALQTAASPTRPAAFRLQSAEDASGPRAIPHQPARYRLSSQSGDEATTPRAVWTQA